MTCNPIIISIVVINSAINASVFLPFFSDNYISKARLADFRWIFSFFGSDKTWPLIVVSICIWFTAVYDFTEDNQIWGICNKHLSLILSSYVLLETWETDSIEIPYFHTTWSTGFQIMIWLVWVLAGPLNRLLKVKAIQTRFSYELVQLFISSTLAFYLSPHRAGHKEFCFKVYSSLLLKRRTEITK